MIIIMIIIIIIIKIIKLLASWKNDVNIPRCDDGSELLVCVNGSDFFYKLNVNKFLLCEIFPHAKFHHRTD